MSKKATFVIATVLMLGVAVFFIADASLTSACTGKSAAAKTAGADNASCSKGAALAGASSCSRSASVATLAEINYREGKRVVLTGESVCGHCDLELTESCQAAFKTADGKIYRLMKNKKVTKMQNTKADKGFKIVTRVRKIDGEKYLEVRNFKVL